MVLVLTPSPRWWTASKFMDDVSSASEPRPRIASAHRKCGPVSWANEWQMTPKSSRKEVPVANSTACGLTRDIATRSARTPGRTRSIEFDTTPRRIVTQTVRRVEAWIEVVAQLT